MVVVHSPTRDTGAQDAIKHVSIIETVAHIKLTTDTSNAEQPDIITETLGAMHVDDAIINSATLSSPCEVSAKPISGLPAPMVALEPVIAITSIPDFVNASITSAAVAPAPVRVLSWSATIVQDVDAADSAHPAELELAALRAEHAAYVASMESRLRSLTFDHQACQLELYALKRQNASLSSSLTLAESECSVLTVERDCLTVERDDVLGELESLHQSFEDAESEWHEMLSTVNAELDDTKRRLADSEASHSKSVENVARLESQLATSALEREVAASQLTQRQQQDTFITVLSRVDSVLSKTEAALAKSKTNLSEADQLIQRANISGKRKRLEKKAAVSDTALAEDFSDAESERASLSPEPMLSAKSARVTEPAAEPEAVSEKEAVAPAGKKVHRSKSHKSASTKRTDTSASTTDENAEPASENASANRTKESKGTDGGKKRKLLSSNMSSGSSSVRSSLSLAPSTNIARFLPSSQPLFLSFLSGAQNLKAPKLRA